MSRTWWCFLNLATDESLLPWCMISFSAKVFRLRILHFLAFVFLNLLIMVSSFHNRYATLEPTQNVTKMYRWYLINCCHDFKRLLWFSWLNSSHLMYNFIPMLLLAQCLWWQLFFIKWTEYVLFDDSYSNLTKEQYVTFLFEVLRLHINKI